MPKYTDEDIRKLNKITLKIAGDYLGISSQAVAIGLRNNLLPIGFAIHNEERDRRFNESWSLSGSPMENDRRERNTRRENRSGMKSARPLMQHWQENQKTSG